VPLLFPALRAALFFGLLFTGLPACGAL